jgi:hypothetical protein
LAVVRQLPEVLLDAFRVDLFGVVTKHIGESEKDLDRSSTVGLIIPCRALPGKRHAPPAAAEPTRVSARSRLCLQETYIFCKEPLAVA